MAALAGHPGAVAAGGAAVLAMAVWLLIYRSVSAPVNRQLSAAAHDGRIPGDARALRRQWDHVINARAALQTVAGLVSGPRAGPWALESVPASVIPPMPGRVGPSSSVPGLRRAFLTVAGGTWG